MAHGDSWYKGSKMSAHILFSLLLKPVFDSIYHVSYDTKSTFINGVLASKAKECVIITRRCYNCHYIKLINVNHWWFIGFITFMRNVIW